MKKPVMFCMKMSDGMLDALKKAADRDRRSTTSLLQKIITEYLSRQGFPMPKDAFPEQRRHPRRNLKLPGMTHLKAGKRVDAVPGVIVDMSMGGVLVGYPKSSKAKVISFGGLPNFDLRFQLPSTAEEISLDCKTRRMFAADQRILVGAAFKNLDDNNLQSLRSYLM
jgi:hypothetical protein